MKAQKSHLKPDTPTKFVFVGNHYNRTKSKSTDYLALPRGADPLAYEWELDGDHVIILDRMSMTTTQAFKLGSALLAAGCESAIWYEHRSRKARQLFGEAAQ